MSLITQWVMIADPTLPQVKAIQALDKGGPELTGLLLFSRFVGLQFFFKTGSLACFALILAILRQQDKEERTQVTVSIPGLQQQQPLVSGPEKKPEEFRA